jgi:hypothetical protein
LAFASASAKVVFSNAIPTPAGAGSAGLAGAGAGFGERRRRSAGEGRDRPDEERGGDEGGTQGPGLHGRVSEDRAPYQSGAEGAAFGIVSRLVVVLPRRHGPGDGAAPPPAATRDRPRHPASSALANPREGGLTQVQRDLPPGPTPTGADSRSLPWTRRPLPPPHDHPHLEHPDVFVRRHVGPRLEEIQAMLKALGVPSSRP